MKPLLLKSLLFLLALTNAAFAADPLPSWNDTAPKKAIIAFIEKVTKEGSPDFLPPAERIAVFDNDGTLWSEQPMPVQFYFAVDRVKALSAQHPEWKDKNRLPRSSRAITKPRSPVASTRSWNSSRPRTRA